MPYRNFFFILIFTLFFSKIQSQIQPKEGPGSSNYKHKSVEKNCFGKDAEEYWIFEPSNPKPASAPLIIFNHGWAGVNPTMYQAWIYHIVKKGNIVVYPRYQKNIFTNFNYFTPNAIKAIKNAINKLNEENHVKPELDKFAIVGHSVGGILTVNIAALAKENGLPKPKALMSVQPGKTAMKKGQFGMPLEDLSKIPEDVLLIVIVGDNDKITMDIDAKKIFKNTPQIKNKNFIIMQSDYYGNPPLISNHFSPCGCNPALQNLIPKDRSKIFNALKFIKSKSGLLTVNAMDYGFWKLFDGLCDYAFYGKNKEYCLGNTEKQTFMGKWSDGTLIKKLIVKNP